MDFSSRVYRIVYLVAISKH